LVATIKIADSSADVNINRRFSRFLTMAKFLQKGDIQINLIKLSESGIGVGGHSSLMAHADLQHPLLEKYDFNLDNFMRGAKHGYADIMQSLYGQDFRAFCHG
jgi:hypothetical protein